MKRLPATLFSSIFVLSAVAALAYGLASPRSTLLAPALVRLACEGRRDVALTFDDGPTPYTAQILDVLREREVKATFFLCGKNVERYPDLARRIAAECHEIGNHTYSHPYLHLTSRGLIAGEIDRAQDALEKAVGRRPSLFRPPFGVRWFPLAGLLAERGMTMALWTVREGDGGRPAEEIERETLARLEPGAILLLHDGVEARPAGEFDRAEVVRALPGIIDGARKAGYAFVALR